jgi:hypothetical protein
MAQRDDSSKRYHYHVESEDKELASKRFETFLEAVKWAVQRSLPGQINHVGGFSKNCPYCSDGADRPMLNSSH